MGARHMNDILTLSFVLLASVSVEIGAVHPKAMPVILTTPAEWEIWLTADWATASKLQRPIPDGALKIVARGEKSHYKRNEKNCDRTLAQVIGNKAEQAYRRDDLFEKRRLLMDA